MELLRRFIKGEDGMGTVELVIIVAVLVGIALIFREAIFDFVDQTVNGIFGDDKVQNLKEIPQSKINP